MTIHQRSLPVSIDPEKLDRLAQAAVRVGLNLQEGQDLFLTAPVSANMIAKAHIYRQGRRIDANPSDDIIDGLPSPPGTSDWATFGGADEGDPTPISVGPEEQQP